jgi:hypothetical protein
MDALTASLCLMCPVAKSAFMFDLGEVGLAAVAGIGQEDPRGAGDVGCPQTGGSRLNHMDTFVDVCGYLGYLITMID